VEKGQDKVIPLVFISYSHDSRVHGKWVLGLASKLRENGVEVILDQWDLKLGDDVAKFMEKGVLEPDRVLMVCTESYVQKADEGKGGVGYETMIVTGELVQNLGTSKFIPVVRQKSDHVILPKSVATRCCINLSKDVEFDEQFGVLLRELHRVPATPKPPLGENPFEQADAEGLEHTSCTTIQEDSIHRNNEEEKSEYGLVNTWNPECPKCGSPNCSIRALIQMGVEEIRQCTDCGQIYHYFPPSPY
jgi:hypothetical protein